MPATAGSGSRPACRRASASGWWLSTALHRRCL
jgi:hypothetical protein